MREISANRDRISSTTLFVREKIGRRASERRQRNRKQQTCPLKCLAARAFIALSHGWLWFRLNWDVGARACFRDVCFKHISAKYSMGVGAYLCEKSMRVASPRRVVAIRSAREIRGSPTDAFTPSPEYNLCSVEASHGAYVAGSRRPWGACTG